MLVARTDIASGLTGQKKLTKPVKKVGAEYQLQLARCFRINLPKLGLEKPSYPARKFSVVHQIELPFLLVCQPFMNARNIRVAWRSRNDVSI